MPATKNPIFTTDFTQHPAADGGKNPILACKYCKWTSANTHRAVEHNSSCTNHPKRARPDQEALPSQSGKQQQTLQLGVRSISRDKRQKLDSAATKAVYINARPFRH
jgi:hypothetical protein